MDHLIPVIIVSFEHKSHTRTMLNISYPSLVTYVKRTQEWGSDLIFILNVFGQDDIQSSDYKE